MTKGLYPVDSSRLPQSSGTSSPRAVKTRAPSGFVLVYRIYYHNFPLIASHARELKTTTREAATGRYIPMYVCRYIYIHTYNAAHVNANLNYKRYTCDSRDGAATRVSEMGRRRKG